MVSGLRRPASTIRSRNCPSDQRDPAPLRSGASVPWNRSSGNGPGVAEEAEPDLPVGHDGAAALRHRPCAPVSDAGMASPDDRIGTQRLLARAPGRRRASAQRPAQAATQCRPARSAKHFRGDRLEPAIREIRFERAGRARRVRRAHAAGAFDVLELAVGRPIDAGDRDAVVGRHQAVAGVDQPRLAPACRRRAAWPPRPRRPWPGSWRRTRISASRPQSRRRR